jgi:hypothetical protein
MANVIVTLELAHRLRENAYSTSWVDYAMRMLEVAADLESFVYNDERAADSGLYLPSLRQIKAEAK